MTSKPSSFDGWDIHIKHGVQQWKFWGSSAPHFAGRDPVATPFTLDESHLRGANPPRLTKAYMSFWDVPARLLFPERIILLNIGSFWRPKLKTLLQKWADINHQCIQETTTAGSRFRRLSVFLSEPNLPDEIFVGAKMWKTKPPKKSLGNAFRDTNPILLFVCKTTRVLFG